MGNQSTLSLSNRSPAWNPEVTLRIINPEKKGITCLAFTKTTEARCLYPISKATIKSAEQILAEISQLNPQDTTMLGQLRTLAKRMLCLKIHQDENNIKQVMDMWMTDIARLTGVVEGPVPVEPAPTLERVETEKERRKREECEQETRKCEKEAEALKTKNEERDERVRRRAEKKENVEKENAENSKRISGDSRKTTPRRRKPATQCKPGTSTSSETSSTTSPSPESHDKPPKSPTVYLSTLEPEQSDPISASSSNIGCEPAAETSSEHSLAPEQFYTAYDEGDSGVCMMEEPAPDALGKSEDVIETKTEDIYREDFSHTVEESDSGICMMEEPVQVDAGKPEDLIESNTENIYRKDSSPTVHEGNSNVPTVEEPVQVKFGKAEGRMEMNTVVLYRKNDSHAVHEVDSGIHMTEEPPQDGPGKSEDEIELNTEDFCRKDDPSSDTKQLEFFNPLNSQLCNFNVQSKSSQIARMMFARPEIHTLKQVACLPHAEFVKFVKVVNFFQSVLIARPDVYNKIYKRLLQLRQQTTAVGNQKQLMIDIKYPNDGKDETESQCNQTHAAVGVALIKHDILVPYQAQKRTLRLQA